MIDMIAAALKGIGWVLLPLVLLPVAYLLRPNSRRLNAFCSALITLVDDFNYRIGELAKWGLPILVITTAFSVFALSIFGMSWTKLSESAAYLHAGVIMLGAAATLLAGQHVRVDIFHSRMSAKSRALIDFLGFYLLLLPVCLIIIWNSQSFVNFGWKIFEGSNESDGIRGVFLLKTLIPIFAIMMIEQSLSISLRAAMCLCGKSRPQRPNHTPKLFPALENQPELNSITSTGNTHP